MLLLLIKWTMSVWLVGKSPQFHLNNRPANGPIVLFWLPAIYKLHYMYQANELN